MRFSRMVATAATIASVSMSHGQSPRVEVESAGDQTKVRVSTDQHKKNPDRVLSHCLILVNRNEVALGRIAQQQTQNPQVKKFAQEMVRDHTDFLARLEPFAGDKGRHAEGATSKNRDRNNTDLPANKRDEGVTNTTDRKGDDENKATLPADPRDGDQGRRREQHFNMMALQEELAQQCLQSARQELESKQGTEFDKCFVGMQIGEHMKMLDHLIVFQRHASPELAAVIKEGQNKTKQHLDHAKEIMKTLEGRVESRAAN